MARVWHLISKLHEKDRAYVGIGNGLQDLGVVAADRLHKRAVPIDVLRISLPATPAGQIVEHGLAGTGQKAAAIGMADPVSRPAFI